MMKLLSGLVLAMLLSSCGSSSQNISKKTDSIPDIRSLASIDLDCSAESLHQKDQAICLMRNAVENQTNTEISQQVNSLTSQGLEASGEYEALFLGGNDSSWTYVVSVDFYDSNKFQSIVTIIKTSSEEKASIKEVLSLSRVKNLIN